ncbi:hypothetical protein ACVC7V_16105 [Hydrogenophaga sp. A37]|uniref:hypothetical protein n=1 Tax=Hydrogenophaga sp. A37 TaxID=1945864 RepID=UPI00117BB92C|nr:hypothetical protein [Hydrogenophaga sp. A37]
MKSAFLSYEQWRADNAGRAEDAANLFGQYLVEHCRNKAIATAPADSSEETRAAVVRAVDEALHNVTDLLEGFWPLPAGDGCMAELALNVNIVRDGRLFETQPISPGKLDLPIGYWSWIEA